MDAPSGLLQARPFGVFWTRGVSGEPQAIVFLTHDGAALMPIYIGLGEAISIDVAMRNEKTPRPLTHDLMASIIETLGGLATRVEIDDMDDKVYYAKLYVQPAAGEETFIDARPSDCIALAVRRSIPIFISKDIYAKNAIDRELVEATGTLEEFFE